MKSECRSYEISGQRSAIELWSHAMPVLDGQTDRRSWLTAEWKGASVAEMDESWDVENVVCVRGEKRK